MSCDFFKQSIGTKLFIIVTCFCLFIVFMMLNKEFLSTLTFVLPICRRPDLTSGLKRLRCRTLIFVGDNSPFHSEALHMTSRLDRRFSALVEVSST